MRSAVDVLACPNCHAALERDVAVRCVTCDAHFPRRDGFIDFAPDLDPQPGLAQRFMEAPAIAAIYERFVRPAMTRLASPLRYRDEHAFLERWLDADATEPRLDLSCGTGRYTRWLAERVGASQVLGLDLSSPMLNRCLAENRARDLSEIRLLRGSALSLPIADGTLASVNCFGALHLYPDPARALSEVARVLAPGGRLTVLTTRVGAAGLDRVRGAAMERAGVRAFQHGELETDLAAAGLTQLALEPVGAMVLAAATRA